MSAPFPWSWLRVALVAAIAYLLIGRAFAVPANQQFWRLAAWIVSGGVFAAHIAYEHFRLRSPKRSLAFHTAVGVTLGAFGLAVAGMVHSLQVAGAVRSSWFLALVLWPIFTAVPAFGVALGAGVLLHRWRTDDE